MGYDGLEGWPAASLEPRNEVEIRPPLAARIYVTVFGFVWCGGVLAGLIAAVANGTVVAVVPAIMLVFGIWLTWHLARLAVIGDEDGLTIRGYFRPRRISKSEIEGFRIGTGFDPFGKCVFALLRGEQVVALDVTRRAGVLSRGQRKLENQLAELRSWLSTP